MQIIRSIAELRNSVKQWRLQGESIAFVPTMGNLHDGHIKLVKQAKTAADRVVVSIFVNPTQFGEGEDYSSYPRTEAEDQVKLEVVAADLLFLPAVNEIYPDNAMTLVSAGELSNKHCGASRPGHFDGVATVVNKLFNMVQPDLAFFGEKDFQQLAIIKNMVKDLNIPVEIISVATQREADGLAMSSRNSYLTEKERLIAPELHQSLVHAREMVLSGDLVMREIESRQTKVLTDLGFVVDYFSICKANDLCIATEGDTELVILAAAKLGKPRLIDNICFSR